MTTSIESKSEYIRNIRENLGLGRTEFANLLGMSSTGERTIRGWEEGEHSPTTAKWNAILDLENAMQAHLENAPFKHNLEIQNRFKFIDLFAGIGGIRLPFQQL
ncbi:DNA (cytosine-5-)-methyltransferase, partial [Vibrio anguillarum]|nr:DNA (cytosine-5-)-methyltransferase [Vibrio anguillarum]